MTYIDRGRAASDQGTIHNIQAALPVKQRPIHVHKKHAHAPATAVFGSVDDLDFVVQLVERMAVLHQQNPDADILLDINETCKASLIDVSSSCNAQESGRAA